MLFTLFTPAHNAICAALKAAYPTWNDDDLFAHARLVNAALLAKIHYVEWTNATLGPPVLQLAMAREHEPATALDHDCHSQHLSDVVVEPPLKFDARKRAGAWVIHCPRS